MADPKVIRFPKATTAEDSEHLAGALRGLSADVGVRYARVADGGHHGRPRVVVVVDEVQSYLGRSPVSRDIARRLVDIAKTGRAVDVTVQATYSNPQAVPLDLRDALTP
jgi:hypothetical protein